VSGTGPRPAGVSVSRRILSSRGSATDTWIEQVTAQAIDSFRGFPVCPVPRPWPNVLKLFNHSRVPTRLVSVE
jgi:hypothetical protein